MHKKLVTYSIMPTHVKNSKQIDEICNDIQMQYEKNISTMPIFSMSLHITENPPTNKVDAYCEDYLKIKRELDKRGLKSGILIQSTIGHGSRKFPQPYQEYIRLTDGNGEGISCPLDKDFHNYIYNCVVKIAKCGPSAILLDDDFRLLGRSGKACACPLHMAKFNKLAGTNLTREELFNIVTSDHEKCEEYTNLFVEVQFESLRELAHTIRNAIDSVDPTIQGAFCTGGDDSVAITKIIAGKNNPSIMRIGSGYYSYNSTSGFTYNLFRTGLQKAQFSGVDYLLAETDTCPHMRYSKTAKQLNAHYVGSILEGVKGAKHWITRLTKAGEREWGAGIAYRKILAKNASLYQTVANLVDGITWHGFKIPVPKERVKTFKKAVFSDFNSFGEKCFERLGLPMYFSAEKGGITCFTDGNDRYFNSEELLVELSNKAIFSSDVAKTVVERGFKDYLGVTVEEFDANNKPNAEIYVKNDNTINTPVGIKKLVAINNNVQEDTKMLYSDGLNGERYVSLGSTRYENEFGGKVAVFCGTPNCESNYYQGYSFLNPTRKEQFISLLKWFNEPVIYAPGDDLIYLKTGTLNDGRNLTSFINLGYDDVENVTLVYPINPQKVSFVDFDGQIKELNFTYENGRIITQKTLNCLDVLILIIE